MQPAAYPSCSDLPRPGREHPLQVRSIDKDCVNGAVTPRDREAGDVGAHRRLRPAAFATRRARLAAPPATNISTGTLPPVKVLMIPALLAETLSPRLARDIVA